MNNAEQFLVVILSSALAVFLVVAIMVGVQAYRLIKTLQIIAMKAEKLVGSAEAVGDMVRQAVGHLSLIKFVKGVVDMVHSKDKRGEK